ncbi:putative hemolysin [Acetobacter senegalensis]|uniref:putative hemolysin n=1 Tax=Acetobacter senegalensis TaxID=446692 RepID=UPI002654AA3C|nr:DUF333 domain-containing protein [Acetobacter senegalensis]MDN7350913.1 DUF333 domain-containing protein [Acetobacter senegalensis]
MKQIFRRTMQAALMVSTLGMLAGCQTPHHEDRSTQRVRPLRMPNPATLYCTKKGGTLTAQHDDQKGQVNFCHLPDGTVMEEWALFRRDNPKPPVQ